MIALKSLLVSLALGSASLFTSRAQAQPPDLPSAGPDPRAGAVATGRGEDRIDDSRSDGRREVEWAYLRSAFGFTSLDLTTFQASDDNRLTAELIPSQLSGGVLGIGAGIRLLHLAWTARRYGILFRL